MYAFAAVISPHAARLRQAAWMDQLLQAYLILMGAIVLKLMLPLPLPIRDALRPLLFVAPLLPLIAKDLAHLPDAAARLRTAVSARAWRDVPKAFIHPTHLGLLRLDRALRRGFAGWLLRRAQPAPPAGRPLTYLERGSYRTVCAIVLFSCLFELPLDAAIVPLLVKDQGARLAIHCVMLAGALSTLAYMLGDRWLIGAGSHMLTEDRLHLCIGARTHGAIPLTSIEACERIDEPMAAWLRRRGIARAKAVRASPLDTPNLVLILREGSRVRLTHLGVERFDASCIFIYLDRPQDLIQALAPR